MEREDQNQKNNNSAESKKPKGPSENGDAPDESSIRTYESDAARAIREGGESEASIAIAEDKRRRAQKILDDEGGEEKDFPWLVVGSVFFLAVGLIAIFGVFLAERGETPTEPTLPKIIFSNTDLAFDITGLKKEAVLDRFSEIRNDDLRINSILNAYPILKTREEVTLVSPDIFLTRIGTDASDSMLRSLDPLFMLGVHSFDGNQPFLIFKIKSFETAFAEILKWESELPHDLFPLFYDTPPELTTAGSGNSQGGESSTTTPEGEEADRILTRVFRDEVVRNRDTRVLKDINGETVLVYSFPDREHLVITTDKNTLIEIFNRLISARFGN